MVEFLGGVAHQAGFDDLGMLGRCEPWLGCVDALGADDDAVECELELEVGALT